MQWLFGAVEELVPVVLFFVAQSQYDFTTGVVVMVLSTLCILGISRALRRSLPQFALWSTIGVLFFALPTILTGEAWYFQLSDTLLDGFFALALLGSVWAGRPLLQPLFKSIFALPPEAWRILTIRWGVLFLVLAACNEFIRLSYDPEVWAWYKLLSSIGIVLFGCYQFTLSMRLRIEAESNWLGLRTK